MMINKLLEKTTGVATSSASKQQQQPTNEDVPGQSQSPDDVDEMDSEGQSMILGIINQLRQGSDLSRITLPTFILERKSMLERITNQLQHPSILLAAHQAKTAEERFVQVVKWYLSGWHITPKAVKKPLNPVLGEYFTCYWDLSDGSKAYYVAEQTSHHPPKSSYFYMNPANKIRVDGTLIPKSKFLGNSAASIMEGVAYLKFLDLNEEYELTQPNMYARGILIGSMKYELGDHSFVKCPGNDLIADVEFKTKGFISGTYNAIYGEIKRESTGQVLYEISGKWNEVIEIKCIESGEKSVLFDATTAKPHPPAVRPIDEQGEYESRRLWKKVTDALTKRDHKVATDEKFAVEERQREQTRQRQEDGVELHPKLFKPDTESKLEYKIYKDIPDDASIEDQIKAIETIAPFLPGHQFHPQFEIPAFKKDSTNIDMSDVKAALPKDDEAAEAASDGDEFVDAANEL